MYFAHFTQSWCSFNLGDFTVDTQIQWQSQRKTYDLVYSTLNSYAVACECVRFTALFPIRWYTQWRIGNDQNEKLDAFNVLECVCCRRIFIPKIRLAKNLRFFSQFYVVSWNENKNVFFVSISIKFWNVLPNFNCFSRPMIGESIQAKESNFILN